MIIVPSNVSAKLELPKGSAAIYGSGNYLTVNSTSAVGFGTGDYTVEAWIYVFSASFSQIIVTGSSSRFAFRLGASYGGVMNGLQVTNAFAADYDTTTYNFAYNTWYHVAVNRLSGSVYFYVQGNKRANIATGSSAYNWANETDAKIGAGTVATYEPFNGYISNLRVVKGVAVYGNVDSFTVPTSPLEAVSGTSLLTANSPTSFSDYSPNAWTVTGVGSSAFPFSANPFP